MSLRVGCRGGERGTGEERRDFWALAPLATGETGGALEEHRKPTRSAEENPDPLGILGQRVLMQESIMRYSQRCAISI